MVEGRHVLCDWFQYFVVQQHWTSMISNFLYFYTTYLQKTKYQPCSRLVSGAIRTIGNVFQYGVMELRSFELSEDDQCIFLFVLSALG